MEITLPDGAIADSRLFEGIDHTFRYTPTQAAGLLGCSIELIYALCDRESRPSEAVDERHFQDISREMKYSAQILAAKLNVSNPMISKLRFTGQLEFIPLRNSVRFPGWTVIEYIKTHAAPPLRERKLDHMWVGRAIRIPGWSIIDFISSGCSSL